MTTDLERLPLRISELEKEVSSPSLFLSDIGPTVPNKMLESPNDSSMPSEENSDSDSSSSSESDDSEPVSFPERAIRAKKGETAKHRRTTRQNKKPSFYVPSEPTDPKNARKRGRRCKECVGCKRDDCGKCIYCLDKPKFGGPGKKKQSCLLRTCSNFEHEHAPAYYSRKEKGASSTNGDTPKKKVINCGTKED